MSFMIMGDWTFRRRCILAKSDNLCNALSLIKRGKYEFFKYFPLASRFVKTPPSLREKNIFRRRRLKRRMKESYLQRSRGNGFSSEMKSRNMRIRTADAQRISNICSRAYWRLRENFVRFISFQPDATHTFRLSLWSRCPYVPQLRN